MRLEAGEHAEAFALARRLRCADAGTVADDRRALLLFWYGSGASHLKTEQELLLAAWRRHGGEDHPLSAAMRAEYARLADEMAAVAADPHTSAARLRHAGDASWRRSPNRSAACGTRADASDWRDGGRTDPSGDRR
jgi:hypothetical protein